MYTITPQKTLYPLAESPHFPFPPVPAITNLISTCIDLSILDISYKWNQIIQFVVFYDWFLSLSAFSMFIHVAVGISMSFLFLPNSTKH